MHRPRKGEGIVEFADQQGADWAIGLTLDGRSLELDGKKLKVREVGR